MSMVEKTIMPLLADTVASSVIKSVTKDPDRPLTHVGFRWACAIALKYHWPSVDIGTAADWIEEYIGVPYGTAGHDWNYAAATELASQYAAEFGERQ